MSPFYGGGRADLLCCCFLGLPERDCPVHGEEVDGG